MRVLTVTAVPAERDAVVRAVVPADGTPEPDGTPAPTGEGEPAPAAGAPARATPPAAGAPAPHRVQWVPRRDPAPGTAAPAPGDDVQLDVLAAGVGPAAAAAGTATALAIAAVAGRPYDLVVSAGIAGGFGTPPESAGPPATVLATAIVAADLGAQTPSGFASVTELGFGTVEHLPPEELVRAVARATGATTGPVLTVSTVTGSAERAAELARRHPGAVAEAMEGFGVAEAAAAHGVPVLELRTVSNPVGPRDRAAWRIGEALEALTRAFEGVLEALAGPAATTPGHTATAHSAAPHTAAARTTAPHTAAAPGETEAQEEEPA